MLVAGLERGVLSSKLKTVEIATGLLYILPKIGNLIKALLDWLKPPPNKPSASSGQGLRVPSSIPLKTQSF